MDVCARTREEMMTERAKEVRPFESALWDMCVKQWWHARLFLLGLCGTGKKGARGKTSALQCTVIIDDDPSMATCM